MFPSEPLVSLVDLQVDVTYLTGRETVSRILGFGGCPVITKLRKPSSSAVVRTENTMGKAELAAAPRRELEPRKYLGFHIRPLAQEPDGSEIVHIKQELGTGCEVMSVHEASVVQGREVDGKSFKS
jgi:hypothetical protein